MKRLTKDKCSFLNFCFQFSIQFPDRKSNFFKLILLFDKPLLGFFTFGDVYNKRDHIELVSLFKEAQTYLHRELHAKAIACKKITTMSHSTTTGLLIKPFAVGVMLAVKPCWNQFLYLLP